MTLPLPSPFTSLTKVTKAQLDQVVASVNATAFGRTNDVTSAGPVTLSTSSTMAGTATITFTLTTSRRIKIAVQVEINQTSASSARYVVQAGYNSGSSAVIGSVTPLGQPLQIAFEGTAARNHSGLTMGTVLLAPGTYTAYASVQRAVGGNTTDTALNFYTLVEDIGSS